MRMLKQILLLMLLCFATIGVNSSQPAKVDQSNYETYVPCMFMEW
jgi:hypothetical protein